MRVIVCDNYEEVSKQAAKIVASQLVLKPDSVLGLATGSTPVGMYNILSEMNKNGEIDFKDVTSFNLDEYYPMAAEHDQSYRYFMNENLFNGININMENTHVLSGTTDDPEKECADFEKMIDAAGGIDLQVLGIGQNGHIGFNEPDTFLYANTHLTDLTENTIQANSRFFEKIEDVPTQALTMGIATILKSKRIIILASGSNKREAVTDLIEGEISTNNPASMLKVHNDVIVICDKEAYSK
ncbi:MAG: glucosamine-6-phosphate deaminase [Ruminococcaceae bacterium]|nr:glucosamine-6-phosphate deaminase [Oscillospiraceae bacterium]